MIYGILLVSCVAVAYILADRFKRSYWWVFFTAIFPVTLLFLLIAGRKIGVGGYKRCPQCEELISYFANICPHCHADQYGKKQSSGKAFATVICPKCRAVNTTGTPNCFQCGKKLV
ncbi:MAG TPA: hypothetical protein DCX03_11905 [Bacteroidales bacterium]|nr:hypothetical protein [Bacteroidales bacterium]